MRLYEGIKDATKTILHDVETLPESHRDWMLYRFEFVANTKDFFTVLPAIMPG